MDEKQVNLTIASHMICNRASSVDQRMSACIDDVANWMSSNQLQLNANKTEIL